MIKEEDNHQKIGTRIRNCRKILGWSQEDLAAKLGTSQSCISKTERAEKGSWIDSISKLNMIADILGFGLELLIFGGNIVKNYKIIPLDPVDAEDKCFHCDDLTITVELDGCDYKDDDNQEDGCFSEEDENPFHEFRIRAWLGNVPAGMVSGLVTNAYIVFTDPSSALVYLDCESAVYGNEALAYLGRVLPQTVMEVTEMENQKLSNEEIDGIFERAESSRMMVSERAENDVSFDEHNIVFLNDIFVNSDYRRHGILTKIMEVFEKWFGKDCSGAAYIYPVKFDGKGGIIDDEENEAGALERNRMIAGKYGWTTEHNAYALKLPEFILRIAEEGTEFRKYISHE